MSDWGCVILAMIGLAIGLLLGVNAGVAWVAHTKVIQKLERIINDQSKDI